jgi:hypothetical protein
LLNYEVFHKNAVREAKKQAKKLSDYRSYVEAREAIYLKLLMGEPLPEYEGGVKHELTRQMDTGGIKIL